MTCGIAVKRPLDFESYLSPESGIESKRSRKTNPQCSPFRPQLGTLASSLYSSSSIQRGSNGPTNPFEVVSSKCQLSETQLDTYLRAEVDYLKRRKLIPRRMNHPIIDADTINSTSHHSTTYRAASSPSSNGSDSDTEANGSSMFSTPSRQLNLQDAMIELYERPQFSFRQVKLICERLLKEQENRLRYEYETLLIKKLEEKHEQFEQFAKEQLNSQANEKKNFSYFS